MAKKSKKAAKKPELRVIYIKSFEDDDLGEMQGFYEFVDGKLVFITGWSPVDADYRSEYMDSLLEHLGVAVETLPEDCYERALKLIKDAFGL
jgi:hypothetical protein